MYLYLILTVLTYQAWTQNSIPCTTFLSLINPYKQRKCHVQYFSAQECTSLIGSLSRCEVIYDNMTSKNISFGDQCMYECCPPQYFPYSVDNLKKCNQSMAQLLDNYNRNYKAKLGLTIALPILGFLLCTTLLTCLLCRYCKKKKQAEIPPTPVNLAPVAPTYNTIESERNLNNINYNNYNNYSSNNQIITPEKISSNQNLQTLSVVPSGRTIVNSNRLCPDCRLLDANCKADCGDYYHLSCAYARVSNNMRCNACSKRMKKVKFPCPHCRSRLVELNLQKCPLMPILQNYSCQFCNIKK